MASAELRELVLDRVAERPGVQQRELAAYLHEVTDLAESTLIKFFRRLEHEGELEPGLDGRRRTYRLPSKAEPVAAIVEPAPRRPRAAGGRQLTTLVVVLVFLAAIVALLLAPDRDGPSHELGKQPPAVSGAPPATAQTGPASAPAAARRTPVAVLNGAEVPGIASRTGDRLERRGFRVSAVGDAPAPARRSVVLYAREARRSAPALARELRIRVIRPLEGPSAALARDARLVVVLGADRR
jgi:hypothetical protein